MLLKNYRLQVSVFSIKKQCLTLIALLAFSSISLQAQNNLDSIYHLLSFSYAPGISFKSKVNSSDVPLNYNINHSAGFAYSARLGRTTFISPGLFFLGTGYRIIEKDTSGYKNTGVYGYMMNKHSIHSLQFQLGMDFIFGEKKRFNTIAFGFGKTMNVWGRVKLLTPETTGPDQYNYAILSPRGFSIYFRYGINTSFKKLHMFTIIPEYNLTHVLIAPRGGVLVPQVAETDMNFHSFLFTLRYSFAVYKYD